MQFQLGKIGVVTISAALVACGGGGGDGGSQSATSAEGIYSGTTSTGRTINGLVLDDGSYYVVYTVANNPNLIAGFVQGTGTSNNGSFSSSNARDVNFEGAGVIPGSVNATYVPKQSFNGAVSSSSGSATFTSTYSNIYEQTPTLAAVAGTYAGNSATPLAVQSTTLTVSASGGITGTVSGGCSFTGSMTPRSIGNAYNVSITLGAAPCLPANATASGAAYYDASTKRLLTAAMLPARDGGVLFLGTKP
jgi:hypothetical protein